MFIRKWLDPLSQKDNFEFIPEDMKNFFAPGWKTPGHGIAITEQGSMIEEVLVAFIRNFAKHSREYTPDKTKAMLLLLDGHKSRCGLDWIEEAQKHNIEVVQTPANTSHYLQAGDRDVNPRLKKTGKEAATTLSKFIQISPVSAQFKLVKGTYGHDAISEGDIKVSWERPACVR